MARPLRAREAVADLPDVSDAGLPRGDTRPREFRSRVNRIVLFPTFLFAPACLRYCLPKHHELAACKTLANQRVPVLQYIARDAYLASPVVAEAQNSAFGGQGEPLRE